MKKFAFVAVAALSMVFASCGKKLSPQAEKAWSDFKEVASKLDSEEKISELSMDEFMELNAKWLEANKAMLGNSVDIAATNEAIVDSMEVIANKVNPVLQKTTELMKAAQAEEAGEAGEAEAAAAEETSTEE